MTATILYFSDEEDFLRASESFRRRGELQSSLTPYLLEVRITPDEVRHRNLNGARVIELPLEPADGNQLPLPVRGALLAIEKNGERLSGPTEGLPWDEPGFQAPGKIGS